MNAGDRVSLIGTIRRRYVVGAKGRIPFVTSELLCDDGEVVNAVWWDEQRAPPVGKRVSVSGDVRVHKDNVEVHVRDTRVERELPSDPRARVVGYYLECVEVEAAADLSVVVGAGSHIVLDSGRAPMFTDGAVTLPDSRDATRWAKQRQNAIGETIVAGYPIVVGRDPGGSPSPIAVPLFISEVILVVDGVNRCEVRRMSESLDVNPAALDLLGLSRDERDECIKGLDVSPEFDEAKNAHDRLKAGLAVLSEASGLVELAPSSFDPLNLSPLKQDVAGPQNSCIVMVTLGGSQVTRKLAGELETITGQPTLLTSGPLGVLLGAQQPGPSPLPLAHPIVVPSTLRQDQAVHAAMSNVFTVVTGPPGTGKSQVLVNVVAAAVAAGETVLFASKNNKAVDVVLERIREVSPRANVMRAGASSFRSALAASVGEALNRIGPPPEMGSARSRQLSLDQMLNAIFARLGQRLELETKVAELQREFDERLRALPPGADLDSNSVELRELVTRTAGHLDRFGERLPSFRRSKRWTIHKARLDLAREACDELNRYLAARHLGAVDVTTALAPVLERPRRSLLPRTAIAAVTSIIANLERATAARAEITELRHRIDRDYQTWMIEDALAELRDERLRVGRDLLDRSWDLRISANPTETRLLQTELQAASEGGAGARSARSRIRGVLPALPAWGVTNLSAGTNFPLEHQMFDLVVIDESSQCDVASAIPLLYRAKRTLIIGDQRQLIHITHLGRAREEGIANRWRLPESDHARFNYRAMSTFALAASRVGEPMLLDLHFRSRAAIIEFSNRQFYDRRLEICTMPPADRRNTDHEPTIRWRDIAGDAVRGRNGRSWRNPKEASAIVEELAALLPSLRGTGQTVGVVAPYRAQVEEIRLIAQEVLQQQVEGISIETAHRFQGDERDVMLLSPVLGPGMGTKQVNFAANPNLLNVALTRARNRLIVVGNRQACLRDGGTAIAEFARYVARLEASPFESPLELGLFEALLARGVACQPGRLVVGHRLALAVEEGGVRIDIECDGAPFHTNAAVDAERDANIELQGWQVMRFSDRELSRDVDGCTARVLARLRLE